MNKGKIFTASLRRRREGRTNYKKRLKILLSSKFRLVVRKSLGNFQASITTYTPKGDKVLFTVDSRALLKLGWKGDRGNLPSAYLVGFLAGKKAIENGVDSAILDLGLNNHAKGSRLYAMLAGAIDAGLRVPFNPNVLPNKERLSGEHIAKYAQLLKDDQAKYKKQFSNYIKIGVNPEDIVKHFNDIRSKING